MNPIRWWQRRRFNREWDRHMLNAALTLGKFRKIGDDWYLVTIVGQTHTHIKGHVWARLQLPRL